MFDQSMQSMKIVRKGQGVNTQTHCLRKDIVKESQN